MQTIPCSSSSLIFRNDIQVLRAIAVLAVIVFHFDPSLLPGGFAGVDIFLVISGFLITRILINKKRVPEYNLFCALKEFWVGRFIRIAPAYLMMLCIVALISAVLFLPADFALFKESLKKAAYFNSNNYFASFGDYFAPSNHEQPLLHTWSLAIEIQFYLLAPLFVLALPIRVLVPLLIALTFIASLVAEYRLRILGIEQSTYYSLYARLPEFFIGALAGILMVYHEPIKSNSAQALGLSGILLSIAFQSKLGPFPGLLAFLPAFATGLILITRPTHSASKTISRLLHNKPLLWIGAVSFSLYLWHWPVLALFKYYTGSEVLSKFYCLLFILITLIMSSISFYFLEVPLRFFTLENSCAHNKARRIRFWLVHVGIITMCFGTVWYAAELNSYFNATPLEITQTRYAESSKICHGKIIGDCLVGDLKSSNEVLVLGDSHAAMLNLFFDNLGLQHGFKARIITGSSCVTIPDFDYQRITEWAQAACRQQIKESENYINQARTIFLAGMWSYQLESENFKSAINQFLKNNSSHSRIYIMSQIPMLNKSPLRAQRFTEIGLISNPERDDAYLAANEYLKKMAKQYTNVTYINLNDLALFQKIPMYEGDLLYYDVSHLNQNGVLRYSEQAREIFNNIMITDKILKSVK